VEGLVDALKKAHAGGARHDMKRIYTRLRELGKDAVPELVRILKGEGNLLGKLFAMNALAGIRAAGLDIPGLDAIYRDVVFPAAREIVLSDAATEIRTNAIHVLSTCGRDDFAQVLLQTVREDPEDRVKGSALDTLAHGGAKEALGPLVELIEADQPADFSTRLQAARACLTLEGGGKRGETHERLEAALKTDLETVMLGGATEDGRLRFASVEIYARIAGKDGNAILAKVLDKERDGFILKSVIEHLVRREAGREIDARLGEIARDTSMPPNARQAAVWALSKRNK
jgi:HEAT repeat protein